MTFLFDVDGVPLYVYCFWLDSIFFLFFVICIILLPLFIVGNGLDVDEYVRRAYKFAYSDCIEVGPVACLPEPPDPNELYPRQSRRYVLVLVLIVDYPSGDKQL